jgi:hypothetical protein
MRHEDKIEIVDGVAGNARITAMVSVILLVLLTAEAATIPLIGQLRGPHIFIGMLLLGPLALKFSSTGYRFARYYARTPAYVSSGPPALGLRLLAPAVVVTTVALFATGVALLIVGPGSDQLQFLHKLSFIVWAAFVSVHVLGHLVELPRRRRPTGGARHQRWCGWPEPDRGSSFSPARLRAASRSASSGFPWPALG